MNAAINWALLPLLLVAIVYAGALRASLSQARAQLADAKAREGRLLYTTAGGWTPLANMIRRLETVLKSYHDALEDIALARVPGTHDDGTVHVANFAEFAQTRARKALEFSRGEHGHGAGEHR